MELNVIYNEDCLKTLERMEDNSIDLVLTSPPYNKSQYASSSTSGDVWSKLKGRQIPYDSYDDNMKPDQYIAWQKKIIEECLRVLKPSGSLFYNHKDVIYNGEIISPKYVYDYKVHQQIVWDRGSSPMLDPHYFFPCTEYIYWIVKDTKKFFFNKENATLKMSVWRMTADKNPHPAPFPILMAENIVASACPENGIVYDPFMGSGTTALAVKKQGGGRTYIGSEISENYIKMANERILWETEDLLF